MALAPGHEEWGSSDSITTRSSNAEVLATPRASLESSQRASYERPPSAPPSGGRARAPRGSLDCGARPQDLDRVLKLGATLGAGNFARVHIGSYFGTQVAVKVVNAAERRSTATGAPLEAELSAALSHPNVVRTLAWSESAGGETMMVMDFADGGSLQEAIETGRLRDAGGQPNLLAVLATARDVASAMAYLHSLGVVHGDLTAGNCMLVSRQPSKRDPRGFSALVGDFGLSVALPPGAASAEVDCIGAVFAMAPEVLQRQTVSRAADVWSFGVLLWQLCVGARPWRGASAAAVIHAVCVERAGLEFEAHPHVPECLQLLASACMARDPSQRPSFEDILDILQPLALAS